MKRQTRVRYREENGELISNHIQCGLYQLIVFIDLKKMYYNISQHDDRNPTMLVTGVKGTSKTNLLKQAKAKLVELGVQFVPENRKSVKVHPQLSDEGEQ